jgi:hypothetical protein
MSDEIELNHIPTELSDEELGEIAGGFDVFFSGSYYEEDSEFSTQGSGSTRDDGAAGRMAHFKSVKTFAFQFAALGLESAQDFSGFLSGLSKLFGRER